MFRFSGRRYQFEWFYNKGKTYFEITKHIFRNVSHDTDFQEIRQVEASTKFREPSILDEESMSFGRRNNDAGDDDLSDLLGSKKVMFTTPTRYHT